MNKNKEIELPIINKEKSTIANIIKALFIILLYFSQYIWTPMLPKYSEALTLRVIIAIGFNLLFLTIIAILFNDTIKKEIKEFKNNLKTYRKFIFKNFAYLIIFYGIGSIISLSVLKGEDENGTILQSLPFWYELLYVCMAAIIEEYTFRKSFRIIIKNKYVFMIISALIFGLIHTLGDYSLGMSVITAIPYMALGYYMAYLYSESNNMMTNVSFHFIWNFIWCILTNL